MKRGKVFRNKLFFSLVVLGFLVIVSNSVYAVANVNHSFDDIDFSSGVNGDFVVDGKVSSNQICLNQTDASSCKSSWEEMAEVGICPPGLSVAYTYYTDNTEDSRTLVHQWDQAWNLFGAMDFPDNCNSDNWASITINNGDGSTYCMDHESKNSCLDTISGQCHWFLFIPCATRTFYQYQVTCKRKVKIECIQKDKGGNLPFLVKPTSV